MGKQRRTFTLDDGVCKKVDELVAAYKDSCRPMSASGMTNWLLARQLGIVGDMQPMKDIPENDND